MVWPSERGFLIQNNSDSSSSPKRCLCRPSCTSTAAGGNRSEHSATVRNGWSPIRWAAASNSESPAFARTPTWTRHQQGLAR
eukprot:1334047-Alexandrium_andersonii.AAC.1